jgi:pimeloyl-ACP methyl ester carboxylesterase
MAMMPLAPRLRRCGFEVLNWGYPSRTETVPELGRRLASLIDDLEGRASPPDRIHFVGHSLGTVLIRWVLVHRPSGRFGQAVLIAAPNQGAAAADRWGRWVRWIVKPIAELTTEDSSAPRRLHTPQGVEIGNIAGSRDHKVRVPETLLEGQSDHVVVRGGHTFLMARPSVQSLTVRFLTTGRFA